MEQRDALNSETADGYSNSDERKIQLIVFKRMVTYRKYFTGAQNSDEIQTKALTLFYTRDLEIVVLHVMFPQPYRFSLAF